MAEEPATFKEYLLGLPVAAKKSAMFNKLNTLLEHDEVGTHINTMHWRILQTPASAPLLLTSDRPAIRTNGLDSNGSHIALPIGPRFLFIASHDARCRLPSRPTAGRSDRTREGMQWTDR